MTHFRKAATVAAALAFALAAGSASAASSVVRITNQSSWEIHQLFLSSTENSDWGPDQLGEAVIGTGESFRLQGIPCDEYDVKLVDEDGDECVVGGVPLCGDSDDWLINDDDLLSCQAASQ